MARAKWNSEMMTLVDRIEYDAERHLGVVRMPPSCCTDMSGAIRHFLAIDPEVRQVQAFAGDVVDVIYDRQGDEWTAFVNTVHGWRHGEPARIT